MKVGDKKERNIMKVGDKISKAKVREIAPDYITAFDYENKESTISESSAAFFRVWDKFNALKRGQLVITKARQGKGYIIAKVTSVKFDNWVEPEQPILRVTDGKYSWRVDGDGFAYPLKGKK
jgi:predicted Mrr-cat superfamily restriction endonuclease